MKITRNGNNIRGGSGEILGTLRFGTSDNLAFEPAPDMRFTYKILLDVCRFIEPMIDPSFQRSAVDSGVTRFDKAGTHAGKVFRGVVADNDHLIGSIGSDALFKAARGVALTHRELLFISKAALQTAEGEP